MATFDDIISRLSTAIPQLNNTSVASVYRRMIYTFSAVVDTVKTEIANTIQTIKRYIEQNRYGKVQYYINAAKAFQYGDNLLFDENYQPYYETIDPSKQIIAQAAVDTNVVTVEIDGEEFPVSVLSMKVAAKDDTGKLIPLTDDQKAAFDVYMANYEIPGIQLSKYSIAGNVIKFTTMNCVYSNQFTQSSIAADVTAAMIAFRDSSNFNSKFYPNHLEQYIMNNVPGVVDFYVDGGQIQIDGQWQSFTESVVLPAGYFNYEDDFSKQIVYVPGN